MIRRGGAPALSLQSEWAGAPLHLACRHGCSTSVLRDMLQASPEMVKIANDTGNKPISILWHQFERNPQNQEVVGTLQSKDTVVSLTRRDARIAVLIEQLTLLLGAALGKTIDDESSFLLHDILSCYSDFGNDLNPFVSLVLLLYPEQVRNVNDLGSLPLHVLVAAAADTSERRHKMALPTPLELLLSMYPPAVVIPSGDGGRLALHLALAHGGRRWRSGGVESLVKVAPDVLAFPDSITQLLPYQLAAAAAAKEGDDLEALETILELLLACPFVVGHHLPTDDDTD